MNRTLTIAPTTILFNSYQLKSQAPSPVYELLSCVKLLSEIEVNHASQLLLAAATCCVKPIAYKFTHVSNQNHPNIVGKLTTSHSSQLNK